MTNFYEILISEARKEICDVNLKRSDERSFFEEVEKKLSGRINFKNLDREASLQKSETKKLLKIHKSRTNSEVFACPSCSFTSDTSTRTAQHIMKNHEKEFPYRESSIFFNRIFHKISSLFNRFSKF